MAEKKVKEKKEETKTEETEEQVKKKEVKEKPKEAKVEKKKVSKAWKGKDWYVILAPETFGQKQIGEVPTTDVKLLRGKTIEISLPELLGQTPKFYLKMNFKINKIEGNKAFTIFNGCEIAKEQMYRIVRKRTQKVELVNNIKTKDNWELQVKSVTILNRKTEKSIRTQVRVLVKKALEDFGKTASADDFVRGMSVGVIQHKIKKQINKIYPARTTEITKIEVVKAPKV